MRVGCRECRASEIRAKAIEGAEDLNAPPPKNSPAYGARNAQIVAAGTGETLPGPVICECVGSMPGPFTGRRRLSGNRSPPFAALTAARCQSLIRMVNRRVATKIAIHRTDTAIASTTGLPITPTRGLRSATGICPRMATPEMATRTARQPLAEARLRRGSESFLSRRNDHSVRQTRLSTCQTSLVLHADPLIPQRGLSVQT